MNVKSLSKTLQQKEQCFSQNQLLLDYAFYLGHGFFLKKQLFFIIHTISGLSYKQLDAMLSELLDCGLLYQKQATTTKTMLFLMNKFALAKYMNQSPQNATSIKLNNTKIFRNIYLMEFLIQEILPKVIGKVHTIHDFLHVLDSNFIQVFYSQNQEDIFYLYQKLFQQFPIKDKTTSGKLLQGAFADDYLAITHEYYIFLQNFRHDSEKALKYAGYEKYKQSKDLNDTLYRSDLERKKHCYNLSNMYAQGFFFKSKLKGDKLQIGIFDTYSFLRIEKLYRNAIFIMLMINRYCGIIPELSLTVYVKDEATKERLEKESHGKVYDYLSRSYIDSRKDSYYFEQLGVTAWKDHLHITYKVYPLEIKYRL